MKHSPRTLRTNSDRSMLMSRIRSKGNKSTEQALIQIFQQHKLTGWRRHTELPGRPDFIFRKAKLAIFGDGCFWHGCPKCFRMPKTNIEFWSKKIAVNKARDRIVRSELEARHWVVLRFWEHQIARRPNWVAKKILEALN